MCKHWIRGRVTKEMLQKTKGVVIYKHTPSTPSFQHFIPEILDFHLYMISSLLLLQQPPYILHDFLCEAVCGGLAFAFRVDTDDGFRV